MNFVAPIVEGHGEVQAVPALLHRIAARAEVQIRVNPPIRIKATKLFSDRDYLVRHIRLAEGKSSARGGGTILVLLDCDDACPARLGPHLLGQCPDLRSGVRIVVALAHREFESWFVAAARSLRGFHGLPDDLEPPARPDAIRNAKGWIGERMERPYDPLVHQLDFTRRFDLDEAAANRSFSRLQEKLVISFRHARRDPR